MDLTMCGLLVEKAEEMAQLYAIHKDWTTVENIWFEERRDGRSTRGSSRKVYRVLSSRFKTADRSLPSISQLPSIFDQCQTERDKAQILYLYLIEDDPLVKYVVHEYVRRMANWGTDGLNFEQETLESILSEFHYADGSKFDYAESTTTRWGEGFRGVMRDIGVLETQRALHGQIPTLESTPLLVVSGYSWQKHGKDWLSSPTGWLYLFQQEQYWQSLIDRLAEHRGWDASGLHGDLRLEPINGPFDWVDEMEVEE
jgi:hypothetical protein